MENDYVLETRELTKEFKGFVAVRNVDPTLRRGTIHARNGPHGAGNTPCSNLRPRGLPRARLGLGVEDPLGVADPGGALPGRPPAVVEVV